MVLFASETDSEPDNCDHLTGSFVAVGEIAARIHIHSDLRLANLLVGGESVKVIDFDDCGSGW